MPLLDCHGKLFGRWHLFAIHPLNPSALRVELNQD